MILHFDRVHKSITGDVTDAELADFIVLSGPNGSGKSHLLEAIENGAVRVNDSLPGPGHVIRRFVANQLVSPNAGKQTSGAFRETWVSFEAQVRRVQEQLVGPGSANDPDRLEESLRERLVEDRNITRAGLARMTTAAGKRLSDFTHDDFSRYALLLRGVKDPFQLSIGELFLSYHDRLYWNRFDQWLYAEGKSDRQPLGDAEFEQHFGAPPWTVMNDTLALIGLEYGFFPPEGNEQNLEYEVKLRHNMIGAEISTDDLSSGEKTLLAIAMTLYTGSKLGEAIELPHVLLLDEADSSLHPSMVKSLLQVIREVFVATYGVKVILTTHSPTTVALAPEEALYTMRRVPAPRLRAAASRDEALNSLTVGLSTLSVRVDNRRTVFVESEHDEACYQELFRLLRPLLETELSLEFVASGRGGQGNCDAVKYLVRKLRECGNAAVWGIVDKDQRSGAGGGIVFNPERYSIENLALDPVILGAFLLREGTVTSTELGLASGLRHFHLTGEHAQAIVDAVSRAVAIEGSDTTTIEVYYLGGFKVLMPAFWLLTKGHDLEAQVCEAYPPLKGFGKGLDLEIISKGLGDLPAFVPISVVNVLRWILDSGSSVQPDESQAKDDGAYGTAPVAV